MLLNRYIVFILLRLSLMLLLRRGRFNIFVYGSDVMHREIVSSSKYSGMSKASSRMAICFASKQVSMKSMEEPPYCLRRKIEVRGCFSVFCFLQQCLFQVLDR